MLTIRNRVVITLISRTFSFVVLCVIVECLLFYPENPKENPLCDSNGRSFKNPCTLTRLTLGPSYNEPFIFCLDPINPKSARHHFQNKPRSNAECFFKSSVYFHKQLVNEFNRIRPFQRIKINTTHQIFLASSGLVSFKTFFKDVLVSQSPALSRDDDTLLKT